LDCSQDCFQLPGGLLPTSIIYPPTPFDLVRTQTQFPRAGDFSEKFICVGTLKNGQSAIQRTAVFAPPDGTRQNHPPARGGWGGSSGGGAPHGLRPSTRLAGSSLYHTLHNCLGTIVNPHYPATQVDITSSYYLFIIVNTPPDSFIMPLPLYAVADAVHKGSLLIFVCRVGRSGRWAAGWLAG
jgi:hypothetical protein